MTMKCSMTGLPVNGPSDAIWDDGEWISWDYINQQIEDDQRSSDLDQDDIRTYILTDLLSIAREYFQVTGRHLQIFGEIGELYAEIRYGLVRHKPHAQGSDGKVGNDFVEVKTISPAKGSHKISVKRSGNFNKLIVVKISSDYSIEAKMISRAEFRKGPGKKASISWSSIKTESMSES